jgi:hypothetical protein
MGRHIAAIAAALSVLAVPAVAPAKEITKVSVCGTASQCTTYDHSDFKSLLFLAEDAGPTDPPAAAAAWYRVRFAVDEREDGGGYDSWTVVYVPSADSLRIRGQSGGFAWVALNPRAAAVLKRAVRDLPAFPRQRLRGLHVEAPRAQVDEVFTPSGQTETTRDRGASGATSWGWIAGGALVAALVLATIAWTLRGRRRVHGAAT